MKLELSLYNLPAIDNVESLRKIIHIAGLHSRTIDTVDHRRLDIDTWGVDASGNNHSITHLLGCCVAAT